MSAVAAVVTGEGEKRIDVVAVGTDARVWHKVKIGPTLGGPWESLGEWFNSAPRAVVAGEGAGATRQPTIRSRD